MSKKLPNLETQGRIADALERQSAIMEVIAEYMQREKGKVPIVLGAIGLTTSSPELVAYEGFGTYKLNMYEEEIDGEVYYKFDENAWPFDTLKEIYAGAGKFIDLSKAYRKAVEIDVGDDVMALDEIYFSNVKMDGFEGYPMFWDFGKNKELNSFLHGVYNGYNEGGKLVSKSGNNPQVNTTLADSRTRALANNVGGETGYQLFDYWTYIYIRDLYLVTMLNKQSNTIFPQGGEGTMQVNGILDDFGHHTGYNKNLTNYLMKFLGIENLFSNVYTQVDGVKILNRKVYICDNPEYYNSDNTTDNYYLIGETPSSDGYIKYVNKYYVPIVVGAGADSVNHFGNYMYQSSGDNTLYFGRAGAVAAYYGFFAWAGRTTLDTTAGTRGVRLVKKTTS